MNISLKCLEVNFVIQAILCWCFERSKDESVSGRRFKHIQIICSLLFSPWMKKLKIPFSPLLSWWCWCMGVFHLISYSCCIKLVMPYWTIWIHNITLYICCSMLRQKTKSWQTLDIIYILYFMYILFAFNFLSCSKISLKQYQYFVKTRLTVESIYHVGTLYGLFVCQVRVIF